MSLAGTSAITELWAKCKAWFATQASASTTSTTASIQVKNSAGTALGSAATIPAATTTAAGVMTADDKTKLNGIATGATANAATTTTPKMDGTAAVGSESAYAKGDHVHPTDTSRAPTSHASSATTYGKGTGSNYGHVKLSEAIDSTSGGNDGVAATPKAVSTVAAMLDTLGTDIEYLMGGSAFDGIQFSDAEEKVIEVGDNVYLARTIVHYGVSSTAASTATKVAMIPGFVLDTGAWVAVKFTNDNTAAVSGLKLQIDPSSSTTGTAKNIKWRGANLPGTQYLSGTKLFVYDGTNWEIVGDLDTNTDTKNTAGSTDSSSKLFLIGATSQAANPQTYSQDTAYVGTDGHLYSDSKQVVNLSGSQALTNKTYNGYTLGAACAKSVDTSISAGSSSANLPTSAAVASFVAGQVTGATAFQGTVNSNSTISGSDYVSGYYWVVATAGTYVGQTCEVGDMVFAIADKGASYLADDFSVVQNNVVEMTAAEVDAICV